MQLGRYHISIINISRNTEACPGVMDVFCGCDSRQSLQLFRGVVGFKLYVRDNVGIAERAYRADLANRYCVCFTGSRAQFVNLEASPCYEAVRLRVNFLNRFSADELEPLFKGLVIQRLYPHVLQQKYRSIQSLGIPNKI